MKHYVIIGGSIAGINCVEGIRSVDPQGEITVVTSEAHSNYGRPLISYYLEEKTDIEHMSYRGADFCEKNNCTVYHSVTAESIDSAAKTVALSDGRTLPYDALCVAAGSAPFVPRFEGLETVTNCYTFTTLSDALALEKAVDKTSRVLIIGGGFIGLKCAEGLAGRAGEITVCDLAGFVMSSILDAECAPLLEKRLTDNGIRLLMGDSATGFEGNTARMKSGGAIDFDVLVIAIGTRPNTSLIANAGGSVGRGVQVDDHMHTSLPDIWAAGDCVECTDITTGETSLLSILPNAAMQGRCAGINMAGGDSVFDKGIRMNSIGFFGMHIMTAGTYFTPQQGGEVYTDMREDQCKKLFIKGGVLTGFILIDDVERAGIYTSLIRERTPLDAIDFEAVKKEPSLLPFGREYRSKKLGGTV